MFEINMMFPFNDINGCTCFGDNGLLLDKLYRQKKGNFCYTSEYPKLLK